MYALGWAGGSDDSPLQADSLRTSISLKNKNSKKHANTSVTTLLAFIHTPKQQREETILYNFSYCSKQKSNKLEQQF